MSSRAAKRARVSDDVATSSTLANDNEAQTEAGQINGSSSSHNEANGHHFMAVTDVNDAEDRVKFAYWVPNVSGGLVISKIPQRTS